MKSSVTTLEPFPPYDFDLTASYLTYSREEYGADSYREGVFRRLLEIRGRPCLVIVSSLGTVDSRTWTWPCAAPLQR